MVSKFFTSNIRMLIWAIKKNLVQKLVFRSSDVWCKISRLIFTCQKFTHFFSQNFLHFLFIFSRFEEFRLGIVHMSIFVKKDCKPKFWLSAKFSTFDQNFDFGLKIRFGDKKKLRLWPKYRKYPWFWS